MKRYDFDKIVERRGSGALKYDALEQRYGDSSLLPLWVADMDFETPDFITEALNKRMRHNIFGYSVVPDEFHEAIVSWNRRLHGWDTEKEWIRFVPGVVKGIGLIINYFSAPGDKIIIQPPVYHIFKTVIEGNGRIPLVNPLVEENDGRYRMNLHQLEQLASDPDCRIMILSNPHNPAGLLWDAETLAAVAEICDANNVLVISDEIHSDMVLRGGRHIPFATVSDEAAKNSITLAAPSKTFNIPGIVSAYAVTPDSELRTGFYNWLDANEFSEPTVFAPIATIAAYTEGDDWRRQMLDYVEKNIDYLIDFFKENIPEIKPVRPQASFLVWLDCRALGLTHEALVELFEKRAGLALNSGKMFGEGGEGFMRINVATPRANLEKALSKLKTAINTTLANS